MPRRRFMFEDDDDTPDGGSEAADKQKLVEIIQKLDEILESIVTAREILFKEELRDDLSQSWEEVHSKTRSLIRTIRKIDYAELQAVGLSKAQLALKHRGFLDSYIERNKKGGVRRLKRVITWGKIAVGSLAAIMPIAKEGAEIFKEYLEAAEVGIEDAETSS